jgi:hypothetical protein
MNIEADTFKHFGVSLDWMLIIHHDHHHHRQQQQHQQQHQQQRQRQRQRQLQLQLQRQGQDGGINGIENKQQRQGSSDARLPHASAFILPVLQSCQSCHRQFLFFFLVCFREPGRSCLLETRTIQNLDRRGHRCVGQSRRQSCLGGFVVSREGFPREPERCAWVVALRIIPGSFPPRDYPAA